MFVIHRSHIRFRRNLFIKSLMYGSSCSQSMVPIIFAIQVSSRSSFLGNFNSGWLMSPLSKIKRQSSRFSRLDLEYRNKTIYSQVTWHLNWFRVTCIHSFILTLNHNHRSLCYYPVVTRPIPKQEPKMLFQTTLRRL